MGLEDVKWDTAVVALKGDNVEFRGMKVYLNNPPRAATLLASEAASSTTDDSNFNAGFMVGLGATTAVIGMAAFALLDRKKKAIEDGAFKRV